ncbi:MAG: hypothetical protein RBT49_08810 [Bacteroidales bacterium]|nr:hypothetical protein [Bacteroidales bacterium]
MKRKLKSFDSYGKGISSSVEKKLEYLNPEQIKQVIETIDYMAEQNRLTVLTDYRSYIKENDNG